MFTHAVRRYQTAAWLVEYVSAGVRVGDGEQARFHWLDVEAVGPGSSSLRDRGRTLDHCGDFLFQSES